MEGRKKESKPCYKKELSIYEKDTLKKIEDFRAARSSWIAESGSPKMYSNVKEGFKESSAYQGRNEDKTFYEDNSKLDAAGSRTFEMRGLKFLRKFKISTKNIRIHHKTLRPLRYYTLRQQLPYTEEVEAPVEKKPGPKKQKLTCSDLELWPTDEPPANLKMTPKKKKKLKRKKAKCKELLMPVPCRDALKRLKAAKLQENMIESCRCDDGKEVTVVIKGICLCDKNSLNHLKLDKVCDEYSRKVASSDRETKEAQETDLPALPLQREGRTNNVQINVQNTVESKPQDTGATKAQKINQDPNPNETVTIRAVSSRDLHKKRIKSVTGSVASKGEETSEEKSKKSVVFDKEEYNKPEEKRKIPDSDLTIYPKHSNLSMDSTTEKPRSDDTKIKTVQQKETSEVTSEIPVKNFFQSPDRTSKTLQKPRSDDTKIKTVQQEQTSEVTSEILVKNFFQSPDRTSKTLQKPRSDDTKIKTGKQKETNETTSEIRDKNSTEIFKKQSHRNLHPETGSSKTKPEKDTSKKQNVSGATGIERFRNAVNRITQTQSQRKTPIQNTMSKMEANLKNLRDGVNNEDASSIILYRNKSENESDFALTPEQMEVIKKNENMQK